MQRSRKARRLAMQLRQHGIPLKLVVYMRDRGCCHYCGRELRLAAATIDHLLPISRGGCTTFDNIVIACVACNNAKGNKTKEEFHVC